MAPLPAGERIAFSLPPTFAAVGVDIPVVVTTDVDATVVDVVDGSGTVLASLAAASAQFWTGTIPSPDVTGDHLDVTPIAHRRDGQRVDGPPVSIVVLPANGMLLERRQVDAGTTVVYDRPYSGADGELDWIPAEGEGININPPGLARVSGNEVAVLDVASSRITCFAVTGESTCTVPLPIAATGDMFPVGDGTLAVIDLRARDGRQELHVLRVDPRQATAEIIYHEYPLQVAGYPAIADDIRFMWDPPSRTAWVSIPEADWPPASEVPDPTRFPYTDALHFDPHGVTRGPTVQRPALRPDSTMTPPASYRLLDGNTWVTFYDTAAPYYSTIARDVSDSGVLWMLIGIGDPAGGPGTTELVRWRPGDTFFEAYPIDYRSGELLTRAIAALDDQTVAVLDMRDTTPGSRIRTFMFPPPDQ